jgi:hypothetical protein
MTNSSPSSKVAGEAAQLLRDAASTIEQYGHTKNEYGDTERGFCARGALWYGAIKFVQRGNFPVALMLDEAYLVASGALSEVIQEAGFFTVPVWNDRPERTGEDVILAFKQAAENLDAAA